MFNENFRGIDIRIEDSLNAIGVRTRTLFTKKFRKTKDIIGDIASKWDTLSDEKQKIICKTLVGVFDK